MILALDLATTTGWALGDTRIAASGTVRLEGSSAPYHARWLNLWWWLEHMRELYGVRRIVREAPIVHGRGTNSYRVAFGLAATVESWCEWGGAADEEISPSAIKKHATGKGNAKKDAMLIAAARRWPDIDIADNNHADALWLLDLALSQRDT